ncbi:MAG: diguanylate cyclase [Nitrospinota bacterium]
MTTQILCEQFQITPEEIQSRRAFLEWSAEDEANLDLIHDVIRPHVDILVEAFYAHLLQFREIQRFLAERTTLDHLKDSQRAYLLSLGRESDSTDYFEERLRIGTAHERVGLNPKWYLGAYAKLFALIASRIGNRYAREPETLTSLLVTLKKIVTLDSALGVETYYHTAIQRLEESLLRLNEAQRQLQEASRVDGLTKIRNRTSFMETLEMELRRSRRFAHPFTLLFLDIDHFKNINDSYGHPFGDVVLKKVAELILSVIRTTDVAGRYGGEEFTIGLVECREDAAVTIAERIRLKIAFTPFEFEDKTASVTVSIGVAALIPQTDRVETLTERADQAMYQAKRAGRNRVVVHA